jgi:hypothetical protein
MDFRDYQPHSNCFTVRDIYSGALADLDLADFLIGIQECD